MITIVSWGTRLAAYISIPRNAGGVLHSRRWTSFRSATRDNRATIIPFVPPESSIRNHAIASDAIRIDGTRVAVGHNATYHAIVWCSTGPSVVHRITKAFTFTRDAAQQCVVEVGEFNCETLVSVDPACIGSRQR